MNTLYFKYAIEVERTRSITQAAENLFMAQPNLSKAIKEMEDTLGCAIFKRTSKGVIPTSEGNEFLIYARNIVDQLEKMEEIAKPSNTSIQIFHISIPRGSYIAHGITRFVSELDDTKGIDVNIQETNSMQAIANTIESTYNLGIIRYQIAYEQYFLDFLTDKKLCYDPIWEFECLVLMSKEHELAHAKNFTYEELSQYTEITHGDTAIPYLSANEDNKPKDMTSAKKKIYLYERGYQFEMLSNIPSTYMWVSPIPEDLLNRYNLIQRKCSATGHRCKDLLIYKKGYKFTDLDNKFISYLCEAKDEVALKNYV